MENKKERTVLGALVVTLEWVGQGLEAAGQSNTSMPRSPDESGTGNQGGPKAGKSIDVPSPKELPKVTA